MAACCKTSGPCIMRRARRSGVSSELVQQMKDEMELHMSALQAKQEGESLLKQQITELSSKVEGLQDDLYKQQAFGESLQGERDELQETLTQREAELEKVQISAASLRRDESEEQEAELDRMRESMAALSQVSVRTLACWCIEMQKDTGLFALRGSFFVLGRSWYRGWPVLPVGRGALCVHGT